VLCRELQIVLDKPEEHLPNGTQFQELLEDLPDRLLNPPIRIFLIDAFLTLHVSHRRHYDEFSAQCLFSSCLLRPMSKQIQLILVEAAFQTQKEAVITSAWVIDCVLIDE
jgi:hypothetical protein